MQKAKKVELLKNNVMELFDYDKTRMSVLFHFEEYSNKRDMLDVIEFSYCSPQGNDNLGIFSSRTSDSTAQKAIKCAEFRSFIEKVDESLKSLKAKLTTDEKIILEKSILARQNDEDVATALSMDKRNIYPKKKSCYIKVALYYGIEVYK